MSTREPSLTEAEVRERLRLCANEKSSEITRDLYDFGRDLLKESLERVRSAEHKATFFAGYGTAIVTLLASSVSKWASLGNHHTLWIAVAACGCAFLCTWFSINVLRLKEVEFISDDEWLSAECLKEPDKLLRYRILTLWGAIHSRNESQKDKAKQLRRAELSLIFSGLFLVYLLVHVAFVQSLIGHGVIERFRWIASWQCLTNHPFLSNIPTLLILGLTLLPFVRLLRRVS